MAIPFVQSINLNKNELLNAVIQKLTTEPLNPVAGQIFFDNREGEKCLKVFDGVAWTAAGEMSAEEIFAAVKSLDGGSSDPTRGLNADTLDNKQATDFALATSGTGILKGDGDGNTEDAEADDIVTTLGNTPVNRATADADGNDIVETYAPLESPDFSGTPTAPTADAGTDTTQVATTAFVKKAVEDGIEGISGDMIFKGVLNSPTTLEALTDYKAGWMWKIGTAGTYAGKVCEVGDTIYCISNFNTSYKASDFDVLQGNLDGVVYGDDSSVVGRIATFSSTTGKNIEDSGKSISDTVTDDDTAVPTAGAVVDYAQPLDDDLTAIAALTGAGVPTRASDNTWSLVTGYVRKVEGTIQGTGSAESVTFTHNLGTKYVQVSLYDSSDALVFADVALASTNAVTITFGSTTLAAQLYHIVVVG